MYINRFELVCCCVQIDLIFDFLYFFNTTIVMISILFIVFKLLQIINIMTIKLINRYIYMNLFRIGRGLV